MELTERELLAQMRDVDDLHREGMPTMAFPAQIARARRSEKCCLGSARFRRDFTLAVVRAILFRAGPCFLMNRSCTPGRFLPYRI